MEEKNSLIQFIEWTRLKIRIHISSNPKFYFKEREIWWASLGVNVGYEQNGKNEKFERPVLILKIFNTNVFWALPLTRTKKLNNKYYFQLEQKGEDSFIILSQLRLISSKRLLRKMRMIKKSEFSEIKKQIRNFLV